MRIWGAVPVRRRLSLVSVSPTFSVDAGCLRHLLLLPVSANLRFLSARPLTDTALLVTPVCWEGS